MSFFMSSMPLAGLMSSPPVSKHTPLPTSVTLGSLALAPAQLDQPRRALRVGGAADGVDQRKVLLEQVVADDRAEFRAVLLGERARGRFELGRAHVVGRRVDQVARQRHAFGDAGQIVAVDAIGQHQLAPALSLRLAVAA